MRNCCIKSISILHAYQFAQVGENLPRIGMYNENILVSTMDNPIEITLIFQSLIVSNCSHLSPQLDAVFGKGLTLSLRPASLRIRVRCSMKQHPEDTVTPLVR